jgi:hypothetical protein
MRAANFHWENLGLAVPAKSRREKRREFGRPGRIFLWESPALDCTVEDISHGGAKLSVSDQSRVPDTFILILASTGIRRSCKIAWRSKSHVGVQFLKASMAAIGT